MEIEELREILIGKTLEIDDGLITNKTIIETVDKVYPACELEKGQKTSIVIINGIKKPGMNTRNTVYHEATICQLIEKGKVVTGTNTIEPYDKPITVESYIKLI